MRIYIPDNEAPTLAITEAIHLQQIDRITEAQVVDWLQAQREKHGLTALQLCVQAPIPAKEGIHNGVEASVTVYAHLQGECRIENTITEAVNKLNK